MANKKFLEEYPLYKKFTTDFYKSDELSQLPKPAIHMHCDNCDSDQTFNMINKYDEVDYDEWEKIPNKIVRLKYKCSACNNSFRIFFVNFGLAEIKKENEEETEEIIYMEKVGQIPAWSIDIDKELEKNLEEYTEYYKNGLICESQGYGVGAFAYFRRIVEGVIDELLKFTSDLLKGEDLEKYKEAFEKTKTTRVAQEKIDLVKDLIPSSLCPNGVNPLGILHSSLSQGLHAENDDECLELSDAIKKSLTFLFKKVLREKDENKEFTDSMKKILDKKKNNIKK